MIKKYSGWILFLMIFVDTQGMAVVPVIDAKSIIGTLKNAQAIDEMKNMAHGDMEKLRGEFDALNPLGFEEDRLSDHTWSEDSWKSALSGVKNGENFKNDNKDIYAFSDQSSQKPEIDATLQTNSILETESAAEYDRLGSYTKTINELSNKIPAAESTKSALDINNKLLVEVAYLEIEMIHMQALANQAASWRMSHDLKSAASTDRFLGEAGEKP
jgi:Type IV secretion system proteins